MPMTIGTAQRDYAATRNILASPVPGVERVRTSNVFRYPNYALFKLLNHIDPILNNLHLGRRDCDILHFFNAVSLGKTPWVTTFETIVPRWNEQRGFAINWGLKMLAGRPCRRLIALSNCTRDLQLGFLADYPHFQPEIEPKITVLHPPQPLLVDGPRQARPSGAPIRFAMVGALFFVKGGREVLRAFDRLLSAGAAIELTIVSKLLHRDTVTHSTDEDLAEARRLIAKWPERIIQIEQLPNDAVLDLFRRSDVALLPSWADTYGYSILEAQATGCPVITTDIRAMGEINNDSCGWVIPMPKSRGRALIGSPQEREAFSERLQDGIERAITAILEDPATIEAKGAGALARIAAQHDPVAHGVRLRAIYDEALGSSG